MTDKEKLIEKIIKECEKEGEPVTREEAEEMAEMEIRANETRHYEKADNPAKKPVKRERKVDEDKKYLINLLLSSLYGTESIIKNVKNESEFSFEFGENEYSVKLVKHRPKKEK